MTAPATQFLWEAGWRVLGLFSLPEGEQALNLRRERHALVQMIRRVAARGKPRRCACCSTGSHATGCGGSLKKAKAGTSSISPATVPPANCCWKRPPGVLDTVTATELSQMLAPARERVKLVKSLPAGRLP